MPFVVPHKSTKTILGLLLKLELVWTCFPRRCFSHSFTKNITSTGLIEMEPQLRMSRNFCIGNSLFILVSTNLHLGFLEDGRTWYFAFDIYWPLEIQSLLIKRVLQSINLLLHCYYAFIQSVPILIIYESGIHLRAWRIGNDIGRYNKQSPPLYFMQSPVIKSLLCFITEILQSKKHKDRKEFKKC